MRVLHFVASPGWGGAEKVCVDLANELSGRCEVAALVLEGSVYRDRFADAVDVRTTTRSGSRRNPLMVVDVARALRDIAPDVVHTHAAKASELVRWARFLVDVPQLSTKHNTRRGWIFDRLRNVTAVSRAVAATVGGEVEVVYNGIRVEDDPGRLDEPVGAWPSGPRPAGGDGPFRVVSVGRLHPHKGFDLLVRAVADLGPQWELVVAGEGPERPALEALVADLGVGGRVRLVGHREDVPALLASADLQVVSSRTEGFSLALVEGLHYAPLLASTPVGVAPEVLPSALLVDLGTLAEELRRLHARREELRALFHRVRAERADDFRIERTAERYLELYRRLLDAG